MCGTFSITGYGKDFGYPLLLLSVLILVVLHWIAIGNTRNIMDEFHESELQHESQLEHNSQLSHRKILHITSTGCVGSSYTAFELEKHPQNQIFHEPFNAMFTGHYRKPMYYGLINCFFLNQCNESKHFHLHRLQKAATLKQPISFIKHYLNDDTISIGFKTVQFTRFDLIDEYVLSKYSYIATDYYILLLVRDPRGTWNSCRKHKSWKESNAYTLCNKYIEMINRMNDLLKKYPNIHIIAIYYEHMASLYPKQYRDLMYKYFDLSINVSVQNDLISIKKENENYGNKSVKFQYANRWIKELNFSQIDMVQNIKNCSQWIQMFGYEMVDINAYNTNAFKFLSIQEMQTKVNPYPF